MDTRTARTILAQWQAGLITQAEASTALESIQVHGAFKFDQYTGYDYINQQWVTA